MAGDRPVLPLFGDDGSSGLADAAARAHATDPTRNVVLEASAGTGKTSVLVARYLNLLRAGVDPSNILAITFTRQAAAEMRERILEELRGEADRTPAGQARWCDVRDRPGDVAISTVDAFCLALLREFPLEADLDPGFSLADETEVPRLVAEAVAHAMRAGAQLAHRDPAVAMLLAHLGPTRGRAAFAALLQRRTVVPEAFQRFLAMVPADLTGDAVVRRAAEALADRTTAKRQEVELLVDTVADPRTAIVARDLTQLAEGADTDPATIRARLERLRDFFLTRTGTPRTAFRAPNGISGPARRRYRAAAASLAPIVHEVLRAVDRDTNVVMVRAARRLYGIAVSEYERSLEARGLLDFPALIQRAVGLLRRMDEFSRSRYRLESRFHHVLVDEFQDTSRVQWELIALLVQSWGEGSGLVHEAPLPPSIFVVGDRKQSIYRFRDADVSVMRDAAGHVAALREEGDVSRSIAHSFRARPILLEFLNDLFAEVPRAGDQRDAFRFDRQDRFPIEADGPAEEVSDSADAALGVVVGDDIGACAREVADEVYRLVADGRVRDQTTGAWRRAQPSDIAILFRTRDSHREFARALESRSMATYVYKGLGFFDADEVKDVRALVRFLAAPGVELRAAALLRSRIVGLADPALVALAGQLSAVLTGAAAPSLDRLDASDREVLGAALPRVRDWLGRVDCMPPADLIDRAFDEVAYAVELDAGEGRLQAWENLKKIRALIRRFQNRGYATMSRLADYIDHLSPDTPNAVIEAVEAVSLMTVHAAKGLEFPVVFLVDLGRGTGSQAPPIRVTADRGDGQPTVAIWPHRTEIDEDERLRDREETKRLLYVAATRARDRLYLSTVLDEGRVRFNRGSFGEVLPTTLAPVFEEAARLPTSRVVAWQARSGAVHRFHLPAERSGAEARVVSIDGPQRSRPGTALTPVPFRPRVDRREVTTGETTPRRRRGAVDDGAHDRRRAVGKLLQQMMAGYVELPPLDASWADEPIATAAKAIYEQLRAQPDLLATDEHGWLFDVPYARLDSTGGAPAGTGHVGWGTIDALARAPDGSVAVLAFAIEGAGADHRARLDTAVRALRVMHPEGRVNGYLLQATGTAEPDAPGRNGRSVETDR